MSHMMDQNNDYQYWVVQLGQLYYAGGLGRTSQISRYI